METLPDGSILLATDGGLCRHPGDLNNTNIYAWEDVDEIPIPSFTMWGSTRLIRTIIPAEHKTTVPPRVTKETWSAWTRDLEAMVSKPTMTPMQWACAMWPSKTAHCISWMPTAGARGGFYVRIG